MRDQTYANLIRRAAELVGGSDELCKLLNVTPVDCETWIKGYVIPPQPVLLRVVDVLIDHVRGTLPKSLRPVATTSIDRAPRHSKRSKNVQ